MRMWLSATDGRELPPALLAKWPAISRGQRRGGAVIAPDREWIEPQEPETPAYGLEDGPMTTTGTNHAAAASTDAVWAFRRSGGWLASLARRLDRVVLALALLILALAAVDPSLAWRTLRLHRRRAGGARSLVRHCRSCSPLAARATGGDALIARAFAGREAAMIPLAAIVGGLTPFCSCGVIPLVAGLFGAGVPLAPVMAFWIASPLMDPAQFFVIAGSLGVGFAAAKTMAAVGMGLLAGYGTMVLGRWGLLDLASTLRPSMQPTNCCVAKRSRTVAKPVWRFWSEPERTGIFFTSMAASSWFLARWLALAFAIESLMTTWLPPQEIARWLGDGPFAIPLAVLVGVPVYINGLATIPLVAGLVQLGMSPAAGLAFRLATTANRLCGDDRRVGDGPPEGVCPVPSVRSGRCAAGWLRLRRRTGGGIIDDERTAAFHRSRSWLDADARLGVELLPSGGPGG